MSSSDINPHNKKPYSVNYKILRERAKKLLVSIDIPRILRALEEYNILILVSETGSGKTSQVPRAVLSVTPVGKVAVTQTTRIAADLVVKRIAALEDVDVGDLVGIRRKDSVKVGKATRIEVVTDGTFVQTAKSDRSLSKYGAIIVDEAHTHTIQTDMVLGHVKELSLERPKNLKVIIMSATIDVDQFLDFFPGAGAIKVQGRPFEVGVKYLPQLILDITDSIVMTVMHAHLTEPSGNTLVFVSGVKQIRAIIEQINRYMLAREDRSPVFSPDYVGRLDCYPLFSQLPQPQQDFAIEATSITITGVTIVIDSCKVKSNVWQPEAESWALTERSVSQAVATQRTGRAGRTPKGVAYRMCTQTGFHAQLSAHTVPQMQTGDMVQEVLDILKIDRNPLTFSYPAKPATETVVKALGILVPVQAVEKCPTGLQITPRGLDIVRLPVDIYSAIMLLDSPMFNCQDQAVSLVAMIEASEKGSNVFVKPSAKDVAAFCEEHMLNAHVLKVADNLRLTLLSHLTQLEDAQGRKRWVAAYVPLDNRSFYTSVLRIIARANFLRVAKRVPRKADAKPKDPVKWEMVRNGEVTPVSDKGCIPAVGSDWIVFGEYSDPAPLLRQLRMVTPIPLELIVTAAPFHWCQLNLAGTDHVQDGLVDAISRLTQCSEAYVRSATPPNPSMPSDTSAAE
ncbi:hypothetical protein B0A48_01983 [Cryoendolithus antarcticus]|uniref:Helicase ATP-binding domain-containing protein n=1 Tax=Cryoendolithus antarcticus TaxID=1507870 RepID=A0A1V8TQU4_9PEZI|nr:hypothetical protein B0A48_01983 [Cryoendolithus antarcticus]